MAASAAYLRRAEATGARGGIGRRARFRSVFRKEWWFDSTRAHHSIFLRRCQSLASEHSSTRRRPAKPRALPPLAQRRLQSEGVSMTDWASLRLAWEPRM